MIPILWVLETKFSLEENLIKENKMIQEIINNQIEKIMRNHSEQLNLFKDNNNPKQMELF